MTAALRVLVIDDEQSVRTALTSELTEEGASAGDGLRWAVQSQGFDGVEAALVSFRPDMVVLDIVEGQIPHEVDSGNRSFEQIWDTWYCPIVVYTSYEGKKAFSESDQVVEVIKGKGSDTRVAAELQKFVPVARMIRSVHEDFDGRIREALRDSVRTLRSQIGIDDDGAVISILRRAVRRLVAAQVDAGASEGGTLEPWERFVIPPLGEHLLTADILRKGDAEWSMEDAFRLVLTPSCDLVRWGSSPPKTAQVLVARCERIGDLGTLQLGPEHCLNKKEKKSQRRRLRDMVREGIAGPYIPIPRFRGHVPLMVANLKRLELIPWDRIQEHTSATELDNGQEAFQRIASTDSPFREMVVWAYLRVTGRPGVPEIDVDGWVNHIVEYLKTGEQA